MECSICVALQEHRPRVDCGLLKNMCSGGRAKLPCKSINNKKAVTASEAGELFNE